MTTDKYAKVSVNASYYPCDSCGVKPLSPHKATCAGGIHALATKGELLAAKVERFIERATDKLHDGEGDRECALENFMREYEYSRRRKE